MSQEEARPLGVVLGACVRRARTARGWTQEELARRARERGLRWSRSTVTALERGTKTLDLAEFVLLVVALDASLPELLSGEEEVEIGEGLKFTLDQVRLLLTSDFSHSRDDRVPDVADAIVGVLDPAEPEEYEDFWWRFGDAERKAAKNLRITYEELDSLALGAWGRTLTEERDARIKDSGREPTSPRVMQARRGHVTRQLLAELAAQLAKQERKRS